MSYPYPISRIPRSTLCSQSGFTILGQSRREISLIFKEIRHGSVGCHDWSVHSCHGFYSGGFGQSQAGDRQSTEQTARSLGWDTSWLVATSTTTTYSDSASDLTLSVTWSFWGHPTYSHSDHSHWWCSCTYGPYWAAYETLESIWWFSCLGWSWGYASGQFTGQV